MKIIGGKGGKIQTSVNGKVVWQMEEMKNAFRFFLIGLPDKELFVEHDELIAAGTAYSEQPPLNILDILEKLEKLAPDFHGVQISENINLIRKRLEFSPGLTLIVDKKNELFLKDETLTTMNFLDFFQEYLTTELSRRDAEGGNVRL